jgi:hypothetical protein
MVSIVLQDTLQSDPYPLRNKIRGRIYINGSLKLDKYVNGRLGDTTSTSPLRTNQGNVIVNPNLKDGTINVSASKITNPSMPLHQFMMADLTYYNYALDPTEISSLFASKFNNTFAPTLSSKDVDKSYLENISKSLNPQVIQLGQFGN